MLWKEQITGITALLTLRSEDVEELPWNILRTLVDPENKEYAPGNFYLQVHSVWRLGHTVEYRCNAVNLVH